MATYWPALILNHIKSKELQKLEMKTKNQHQVICFVVRMFNLCWHHKFEELLQKLCNCSNCKRGLLRFGACAEKKMTRYFDLSNVVLTIITQNHDNFSSLVVMLEQLSCTLNQNILSYLNKWKKLRSDDDRSLTGKPILFSKFSHIFSPSQDH